MSTFQPSCHQGLGITGSRASTLTVPVLSTIPASTFGTRSSRSSCVSDVAGLEPSDTLVGPNTDPQGPSMPVLRSMSSMRGLLLAEMGDSMVEMDVYGQPGGSGYRVGRRIEAGSVTPGGSSTLRTQDMDESVSSKPGAFEIGLTASDSLRRTPAELHLLLGDSNSKLKPSSSIIPCTSVCKATSTGDLPAAADLQPLAIERAKSHARVEVDIVLESETCVQGGWLKGIVKIRVRKCKKYQVPLLLSEGKLCVIGYESIPHESTRCTFYQYTALLADVSPTWHAVFSNTPTGDGWAPAKEGVHALPFALRLPADGSCGTAKGVLSVHSGVSLSYVVLASIKLRDPGAGPAADSIAHFYRSCSIWPRLSLASSLAQVSRPLVGEAAKTVLFGGSGKIRLCARMHRLHWVSGQPCFVHLEVMNESKRTVKSAGIELLRTTTVFRPLKNAKESGDNDPDACETTTLSKVVASNLLVMGSRTTKGHASAKGWWMGVQPGQTTEFTHHVVIPSASLSVIRVRLLEVEYTIRVCVSTGGLSSDVQVALPIKIINFLSIDPPPSSPVSQPQRRVSQPQIAQRRTWYRKSRSTLNDVVETDETVPGMKYSSTMPVLEPRAMDMAPNTFQKDPATFEAPVEIQSYDDSEDADSVYPPSESAATLTQHAYDGSRMNITSSLDEIDRVIGSDSRIYNFVTASSHLSEPSTIESPIRPRGPRPATSIRQRPPSIQPSLMVVELDPETQSTPLEHVKSNTFTMRVQEKLRAQAAGRPPFPAPTQQQLGMVRG